MRTGAYLFDKASKFPNISWKFPIFSSFLIFKACRKLYNSLSEILKNVEPCPEVENLIFSDDRAQNFREGHDFNLMIPRYN